MFGVYPQIKMLVGKAYQLIRLRFAFPTNFRKIGPSNRDNCFPARDCGAGFDNAAVGGLKSIALLLHYYHSCNL